MTGFSVHPLPFDLDELRRWRETDERSINWPVVYVLDDGSRVYVGETLNTMARMRQHLDTDKKSLTAVRLVLDDTFNKSVCLDLESRLIGWFAGDEKYIVLNSNKGVVDADYFDRDTYRGRFDEVFEALRAQELFTRSIPEIENSELFKLSPFKALNRDQAIVMEDILEGLFDDLAAGVRSSTIVQGDPGTGKTIIAIFLVKLLRDISMSDDERDPDGDSLFEDFFTQDNARLMADLKIGIVVPQQALRTSMRRVFARTPGLDASMVLSPFDVGGREEHWDLLIVDEAHRLNQRSSQASGVQNKQFRDITIALYGEDDKSKTQKDWIECRSTHQLYLLDSFQSVRPGDLPSSLQKQMTDKARGDGRHYRLATQMRVRGGTDYVSHVRALMRGERREPVDFGEYDLRMFDDVGDMHNAIKARDSEVGLARLVAGYAWKWKSSSDPEAVDIELDGVQLQWNRTAVDWITSPGAVDQVGSIHTVQGYDLNYAGVIIGPDIRMDPVTHELRFNRANYFDTRGKADNRMLGITSTDDMVLQFVSNIYGVLMTRGVRGTYVYVCDPVLREWLRPALRRGSAVRRFRQNGVSAR